MYDNIINTVSSDDDADPSVRLIHKLTTRLLVYHNMLLLLLYVFVVQGRAVSIPSP